MIPHEIMTRYWKFTDEDGNQMFRRPWKYDQAKQKYIFLNEKKGKSEFLTVGPEWFDGKESRFIKRPEQ